MKYMIGVCLTFFMQTLFASDCRVDGGGWIWIPTHKVVDVRVPVKITPGSRRILLDGYTLECIFSYDSGLPASARDYWHTTLNGVEPGPKLMGHTLGLNIHNVDYDAPVRPGIHIATMYNNHVPANMRTYMYILNRGDPSNPINIRYNDLIGTILLRQTNNTGKPPVPVVRINLIANNSLIIEPSTCTINGNRAIDVNFNQVDPAAIGESSASTSVTRVVRLNYSCPNPGITMPITITFKGASSAFNSGLLHMSNPNLATGLLRGGVQIGPNQAFRTNLYNSSGADDVTFALVRKSATTPASGNFTGSATLVMGLP